MSGRINIEPDQLKELASELGQRERECGTLTDLLEWNYNMARSVYPEMDCTYSGALYQGLAQKLTQYRSLLDEAQAVVKRTEMEFRQLDEGFLSKLGQFGLDMIGYYDVIRIGAEYDPVTGEKLSGWDHLIAGGWTVFNLASFGLGGIVAKGAVKLFKSVKNVLHPNVIDGMLKGAFNAAKRGVLSAVYRAGNAIKGMKNVTLFPGFRMVTGDGRLISTPPMKMDDLVQRFSRSGVDSAEREAGVGTPRLGKSVDVDLKYKEGWTETQRAEADAKVKALTEANTVKTPPQRSGTAASSRYKKANGPESIPQGKDVDHTIDLQLGGADDILNMNPLDSSVNRSLGKQIQIKIKDYPVGTVFDKFKIRD
ncbi:pre-toxin TG domain-containing protein [Aneurinibacillus tyrosinisolvens]|uniref:pre-toxin TG domain-containing protein n=1 Tax=Aneurinibacillus tyrosinisolvens TaxID=1443435 RepID=UPI00069B7813|nr:pre-toxin TG domain-containing protein [Aneurinibacillus tyrosinisolvens]